MKNYIYQNSLISKKQLKQILGWSFTNYDSMQACTLADELKYLGFRYATQAGLSISIEDLRVPFIKGLILERANQEINDSEKIYLKGKITDVERLKKIIDTWGLASESLKEQVINYFKNYDPLNSVYIMAFSGARGNITQVRQLVGMRGLMSDPSGEILNLPIKKNFREGLTITDYLISGYGARKGIIDTALKTANSGYLTRRLIDVAQDILIREKDCQTEHAFLISKIDTDFNKLIGRVLSKHVIDPLTSTILASRNTQITPTILSHFNKKGINQLYIRSPLTCILYRSVCQQCYGWDLATENLIDIGEAIGILAGQSIGEPGTQLTMRTFHTGGIFTSEIKQRIFSPTNGIIKFSKTLQTVMLRTNRGENVLVTKNSGGLFLVPQTKTKPILKIEIPRNTIVFPKSNQYVQKSAVIGELINVDTQLKREVKPLLAMSAGEVIVPKLKIKNDSLVNNKLLWVLYGKLYNSPYNSYVNFYSDYKLNRNSFIFRTKIVNSFPGKVIDYNDNKSLYRSNVLVKNHVCSFPNFNLFQISTNIGNGNTVIGFKNLFYLLYSSLKNNKLYLKHTRKNKIGHLITNKYKTKTGGCLFYDCRMRIWNINLNYKIYHFKRPRKIKVNRKPRSKNNFLNPLNRTLLWLEEETHILNCDPNVLLVSDGDFISENFEIIPNCFSKTSGLVRVEEIDNIIKTVIIQSGLLYEGGIFIDKAKKVYFPGEKLFSNVIIVSPSICDCIYLQNGNRLLVSPIQLYEFPNIKSNQNIFKNKNHDTKILQFTTSSDLVYKSKQKIQFNEPTNLVLKAFSIKGNVILNKKVSIELQINKKNKNVDLKTLIQINFNNYIFPKLKYKKLNLCILTQRNQFLDKYTNLTYLESLTPKYLGIVKIKVNLSNIKQILLISNDDCSIFEKKEMPTAKLDDFILNTPKVEQIGQIIIENNKFFTVQKGRPYFFPDCQTDIVNKNINLSYKFIPFKPILNKSPIRKNLFLTNVDRLKISIKKNVNIYDNQNNCDSLIKAKQLVPFKIHLSKMFLKKNGKLYSCLIPRFLKQFSIGKTKYNNTRLPGSDFFKYREEEKKVKISRTLLAQTSETNSNILSLPQLNLIKFLEYPLAKATKSIGLHSITEDFFEKDVNSVFCYNGQFLEDGDTIGLLNLEKEITGDIVQGLPRIEEILEARKKNQSLKRIPANRKKGLLMQHTSLDPTFEFRKVGLPIKENEKINPHKLLKVYFNYYGLVKSFICDQQHTIKYARLITNFEGSYKSFKKVQAFMLNSVQNVYKSQGVNINDKHLEVIIKQMTTKVLISDEGDAPLLKREIIDLYHIEHINKILRKEKKQIAYYLPLLFGITRAALNNPSFISAASFQETTRVLTKAAIEGRIDWLRGLKENIIIGQLIPAGTGSRNYKNCFKKPLKRLNTKKKVIKKIQT